MSPRMGITYEKIVNKAAEVVDEEGFGALTLATLSKRLNIRPPSLYNHVTGLQDIQVALAVKGLTLLDEEGRKATSGLGKHEAVIAFAKSYVQFVHHHPGLYEAAFSHLNDQRVWEAGELLVDFVSSLMTEFGVKQEEMTHVIRGLRSLLHGFADIANKKGFQRKENIEESMICAVRVYLAGLA
ncbi:TetR/AcrR family transcriptional regulator [Bacillus sp. NPDC077027]|uniref:TetR/AcrR family transcriptional regulator n=1 Tax=Bacillus sp. NPDC077027 TaxID=3390548 RepID=UPI003D04930A